jgi:hypothetical protein
MGGRFHYSPLPGSWRIRVEDSGPSAAYAGMNHTFWQTILAKELALCAISAAALFGMFWLLN